MSTRKYQFEPMTDAELAELQEKFPRAVQTITTHKPVYSVIAKLLDCGVEVPGVRLKSDAPVGLPDKVALPPKEKRLI